MKVLTTFTLLNLIYGNLCAQIWDYPPKPISNWVENDAIPKDSLIQLSVWNHETIDGEETGNKSLKLTQEFDSLGNTKRIIYGNGDTILYDHYIHGFWQVKIANGITYEQEVRFEDRGNVVDLSVNDFHHHVQYDSLNRPIRAINQTEEFRWFYENDQLTSYLVLKNGVISEKRTFYHDTTKNTIAYTSQFYDNYGQEYPNPDSVCAFFNEKDEIYQIVSFSHYSSGWDTLTITLDDSKNQLTSNSTSTGCTQTIGKRDDGNRPTTTLLKTCEGILLRKTSYSYVFVD